MIPDLYYMEPPILCHRLPYTTDFVAELRRLGLSEYLEALVAEGFDTWETVLDITESDLNSLNVKIGHRKILQQAIVEWRGRAHNRHPPIARTKRKYTRHPKPDEHAPERPPSAYVLFSNQVRESLKDLQLSFTEIAKLVGGRWQVLPAEAREDYQGQANARKQKFYAELAEYKESPEYNTYQKYLEEFKAKHTAPHDGAEGKHSRLETQTRTATSSSTHEYNYRWPNREVSSAKLNLFTAEHSQAELSPTISPWQLPRHSYPSTSATLPSLSYIPHYTNPVDSPLDRSYREPTRLLSLTHGGRSLASESGCGHVNDPNFSQALLQPVPNLGPSPFPLDRRPSGLFAYTQPQEPRSSLSAALVRVEELARITKAEAVNK